jgi:glycosyltransferase involved in cell wall biosynthesis
MLAFSHYSIANDIGGVTTWLENLLRELRARNEEIALNLHHFGDEPQVDGIQRFAESLGIPVTAFSRGLTSEPDVRRTLAFLNESKASVYLPQCLPAMHYAAKLAQRRGIPWVFTLHSDDPLYWTLAEHTGPPAKYGVWVAVSECIAEEARRRFPKADVRMIPYGVAPSPLKSAWNDHKFRVVYSGRLVEYQKRASRVIEVFIEACKASPRIEALVIGDGEERRNLEEMVADANLCERILFRGRVSPSEVGEELLTAQAIVLMSDYEGLPVALLEAMARGVVPVVRAVRSGIPEIVRDSETGYLVDDDPWQAAKKLVWLSQQPGCWSKNSNSARALVSTGYSHDFCVRKWIDLIAELKARSSVRHPIRIPRNPKLPPLDPRVATLDSRLPGSMSRAYWLVRRVSGRILKSLPRVFSR